MNIVEDLDMGRELAKARKELEAAQKEDLNISAYNEAMQGSFNALAAKKEYENFAYVTYEDLSKLSSSKENNGKKLIVIKAPPGTEMEIPEQEDKKSEEELSEYYLMMKSKGDPIMLFTVETEIAENPQINSGELETKEQVESLKNMYAA